MPSTETKLKVVDLLQQGRKIDAVKYVREKEKLHLKEAAELVQEIELEFFPDRKGSQAKSFNMSDPGLIAGSIFMGLGAIFLLITGLIFWFDYKKTNESTIVMGTVTSLDYSSEGTAAPVIRYRFNGEKKIIQGTVWSNPPSYDVGEEVEILINNNNPAEATINGFFERYFTILIFGFFAVIFGGIGGLVFYFLRN
jgi:Protein of unknown function (DUF3592)